MKDLLLPYQREALRLMFGDETMARNDAWGEGVDRGRQGLMPLPRAYFVDAGAWHSHLRGWSYWNCLPLEYMTRGLDRRDERLPKAQARRLGLA